MSSPFLIIGYFLHDGRIALERNYAIGPSDGKNRPSAIFPSDGRIDFTKKNPTDLKNIGAILISSKSSSTF